MELFCYVRLVAGGLFLVAGLIIFLLQMIGVYKMKYVLNRMHAAAMGDSLGLACSVIGIVILNGLNFVSLKMLLVLVFMWFSSPVSSHLIAKLEVITKDDKEEYIEISEKEEA